MKGAEPEDRLDGGGGWGGVLEPEGDPPPPQPPPGSRQSYPHSTAGGSNSFLHHHHHQCLASRGDSGGSELFLTGPCVSWFSRCTWMGCWNRPHKRGCRVLCSETFQEEETPSRAASQRSSSSTAQREGMDRSASLGKLFKNTPCRDALSIGRFTSGRAASI
ncbi:hypothetical protein EYF80_012449 [Liparis tanakae]|uniref:Uncharacterized protein n=1 Tax=Liparis tanakae TaxID=230148 RepID=A0A4Z2II24_9TELE|nr:hypothetical protein EYF80_012449 [Liparis tanakae]